jgi:hypothetical protein
VFGYVDAEKRGSENNDIVDLFEQRCCLNSGIKATRIEMICIVICYLPPLESLGVSGMESLNHVQAPRVFRFKGAGLNKRQGMAGHIDHCGRFVLGCGGEFSEFSERR